MIIKLLTEHHLEFLSLKGGCRGSSKSTLVKLLEISCRGSYVNDKDSDECTSQQSHENLAVSLFWSSQRKVVTKNDTMRFFSPVSNNFT